MLYYANSFPPRTVHRARKFGKVGRPKEGGCVEKYAVGFTVSVLCSGEITNAQQSDVGKFPRKRKIIILLRTNNLVEIVGLYSGHIL
jgi:hypothetical protein